MEKRGHHQSTCCIDCEWRPRLGSLSTKIMFSRRFTVSNTDLSWQGSGDQASWCRLFLGDRFHLAGGMHSAMSRQNILGAPEHLERGVKVPSMYLKDIVSMAESSRVHNTGNGSIVERVCELSFRKINTNPMIIDVFKGYRALKVGQTRYFIDPKNGSISAESALLAIVNQNNDYELVVGDELLNQFVSFVGLTNDSGGYAVCEIAKLSDYWYGIRHVLMIGKAQSKAAIEYHSASITHGLRQGKRYIREYHSSHLVGAGRTRDMVAHYGSMPIEPYSTTDVSALAWDTGNASGDSKWKITAHGIVYSINEDGTIAKDYQVIQSSIERPLFGKVFMLESRSSKTNCQILVAKSHASQVPPGYASTLSLLGASVFDTRGNLLKSGDVGYVRADNLSNSLRSVVSNQRDNCLSIAFSQSGQTHKAGAKGSYPIFRMKAILKFRGQCYDCETLKTIPSPEKHNPESIRYLELSRGSSTSSSSKASFTESFSDSLSANM